MSYAYLLVSSFISFALAFPIFFLVGRTKQPLHFIWGGFSFFVALWAFGFFWAFYVKTYEIALFWFRFLNLAAIPIPALFFTFTLFFLKKNEDYKKTIILVYGIGIIYFTLCLAFPKLFIPSLSPKLEFTYYPNAGILYPFFALYYGATIGTGIYFLINKYRASKQNHNLHQKNLKQFKIIFFSLAIGILGGSTTFPLVFNIPVYPFGVIGPAILALSIGIGIIKYEFFDLKVLITKTFSFILAVAIFISCFSVMSLLYHHSIFPLQLSYVISTGIYMIFLMTVFEYIRHLIHTPLETKFLKGHYKTEAMLTTISSKLLICQTRKEVLMTIAKSIKDNIQIKSIHAYVPNIHQDPLVYHLADLSFQTEETDDLLFESELPDSLLQANHPFLLQLQNTGQAVCQLEELPIQYPFYQNSLFLTLQSYKQCQGILILGPKISEKSYTEKDLLFFNALINQMILVLDRVTHYEKLSHDYQKSLSVAQQANMQKTFATLTKQLAHEIRNPMLALQTATFSMNEATLKSPAFTLKEDLIEYLSLSQEVIDQIEHVTTEMLKYDLSSNSVQIHPIYIQELITSTLVLLQATLTMKGIRVNTQFLDPSPQILGNKTGLNQVFINILTNAIQAIEKPGGAITISVSTSMYMSKKSIQMHGIKVDILDNGKGMTKEQIARIYEPFFTTKYEGTGLGMAMVFQMINQLNGLIEVSSEPNKGSTISIFLPQKL